MTTNTKFLFWIAAGMCIAGAGIGLMYLLVYILPMGTQTILSHVVFTLALIILGLGAPYLMVKAGFHAMHTRDPREKEMHLSDIPKDKEDLDHAA
jgi:hypothetical protein